MGSYTLIGLVVFGLTLLGFVLTLIITSVIITSDLNDRWFKPGEQFVICKGRGISVTPKDDGFIGYSFPDGTTGAKKDYRYTTESFNGTIPSIKLTEITTFNSNNDDTVFIDFISDKESELELFYFKRVLTTSKNRTAPMPIGGIVVDEEKERKNKGNDNPITPKRAGASAGNKWKTLRFSVFKIKGTGLISDRAVLPGDYEYRVGINGVEGTPYSINITHYRKYYISDDYTNFTAGEKTTLNSEKKKKYCVALEMTYDGPVTDPENSKSNVDLYSPQRYNLKDTYALSIMGGGLFVGIFILVLFAIVDCREPNKNDVEMN